MRRKEERGGGGKQNIRWARRTLMKNKLVNGKWEFPMVQGNERMYSYPRVSIVPESEQDCMEFLWFRNPEAKTIKEEMAERLKSHR